MSYQPHESFIFFDPTTLQSIPYTSGSVRTSNTQINPNSKSRTTTQASTHPSVMLTNSGSQGNANFTWIPDFGASFHVTGEPQNIKQFSHFDESNQIFIGNGEGLSIFVVGSSSFVPPNDSKITFKLHNLLHVPSITKNLLSVSQFVKDNLVFFEFHPYMCLVKSQGTNRVHLQGVVSVDGLYYFHNLKLQDHLSMLLSSSDPFVGSAIVSSLSSAVDTVANKASNVVSNFVLLLSTNVNLWHARFGHPIVM